MDNTIDISRLDDKDYSEVIAALYNYKQIYKKLHPEYADFTKEQKKDFDKAMLGELIGVTEPVIVNELEEYIAKQKGI